jgi:hypothetical protein
MSETVVGVGGCDLIEDGLHGSPELVSGSAPQPTQQLLDLAEDHLDRVQIRRIRR